MSYGDFRDLSKSGWSGNGTAENISIGSLQRIADATEKMAGNYIFLQNEKDTYERYYREAREDNARMARRIAALQGVITRMKKRQEAK